MLRRTNLAQPSLSTPSWMLWFQNLTYMSCSCHVLEYRAHPSNESLLSLAVTCSKCYDPLKGAMCVKKVLHFQSSRQVCITSSHILCPPLPCDQGGGGYWRVRCSSPFPMKWKVKYACERTQFSALPSSDGVMVHLTHLCPLCPHLLHQLARSVPYVAMGTERLKHCTTWKVWKILVQTFYSHIDGFWKGL